MRTCPMPRIRAMLRFKTSNGRVAQLLADAYLRATILYLAFVALLWFVGLEGIHGHPFPFYAQWAPVFTGSVASSVVFGVVAIALGVRLPRQARWKPVCYAVGGLLVAGGTVFLLASGGEDTRMTAIAVTGFVLSTAFLGGAAVLLVRVVESGGGDPGVWFPQRRRRVLFGVFVFAVLFPILVASIRGGPAAIAHPYERAAYEYVTDIGVGGSIPGLFAEYAEVHPHLSMHSKVHPPGPIAILWLMSYVVGRTPFMLGLATVVFGGLSVFPMHALAREILTPRAALVAALLYACVPTIVLFTATSADILFMPFTLATLLCFWRALHRPSIGYALVAGALYGTLGLISFSLLTVGAFFGFIGLWRLGSPKTRMAVIRTAALMLVAVVAVHGAAYLTTGYNSIEVFELAKAQFDADQANLDLADPRLPSWAWKIANPLAWFFYLGVPVSLLCLWRVVRPGRDARGWVWSIALTLLVLDILYLARGEGERSAMYIVPFVVLPAAHMLDDWMAEADSWRPAIVTLLFLGVQSIAIECMLYTYW